MTMRAVAVEALTHVAEARRAATALAVRGGFGPEDAGRVALVATELSTNLLKHGGGGELLVSLFEDRTGEGVECLAIDRGPGIADVDRAMRDGHSTAGTAGSGLGAVCRASHHVDIHSQPGAGAVVLARLQTGRPGDAPLGRTALSGVVSLPKAGEEANGDAWCLRSRPGGVLFLVADGLGHGPSAAAASTAAVKTFLDRPDTPMDELMAEMHQALRSTRGAACTVADIDLTRRSVREVGVGNVAAVVIEGDAARRMISHNGTVGLSVKRIQVFESAFDRPPVVVLASDGLATGWSLGDYPGLGERHPSVIAGVLYRDFNRGRDDVTVLVVRGDQL